MNNEKEVMWCDVCFLEAVTSKEDRFKMEEARYIPDCPSCGNEMRWKDEEPTDRRV